MKSKYSKLLGCVIILTVTTNFKVKAQLSRIGASYFQNQYLVNPAMAGSQLSQLEMNIGYSSFLSQLPGSPTTKTMTLDYRNAEKKVGLGMNVLVDVSGLINRTRIMGTYSYHLPLGDQGQELSFGLSLGLMKERIANSDINGSSSDLSVANFNSQPAYLDGDMGVSYRNKKFHAQLVLPNLKTFFRTDAANSSNIVDVTKSFASLSYTLNFANTLGGLSVEPMLAYQQIKGLSDVIDFGANMRIMNDKVNFMAMYHSTKNISLGLGTQLGDYLKINTIYSSSPSYFKGIAGSNFEINLGVNLKSVMKKK